MPNVEIIESKSGQILSKSQGRYKVIETTPYIINIKIDGINQSGRINIDGVIDENGSIRTLEIGVSGIFFINCLGYFTLSKEGIPLADIDVVTKKMNNEVACQLFDFVYKRNTLLFDGYLNKQKSFNVTGNPNKEISLISYIGVIKELIDSLGHHLKRFKDKPLYKLKSEVSLSNYDEKHLTGKSIEWILRNLDELSFSSNYKSFPGAFEISNSYAILQKIEVEKKVYDYDIYENQVLLGILKKISKVMADILDTINDLTSADIENSNNYASFDSIKQTIIKHELKILLEQRKKLFQIKSIFSKIFNNVKINEAKPRLTHNFRKEKHYRDVFQKYQMFHNSTFSINALSLALGIKNLDKLYELYTLYQIADCLILKLGNTTHIEFNDQEVDYFEFKVQQGVVRLYYQYKIEKRNVPSKYPWFKLFNNSSINRYYTPDIIIEYESNEITRYAVLDAKFSTTYWIGNSSKIGETTQKVIGKYFYSISHKDHPYVKSDYICLLYPKANSIVNFTSEPDFFPKIMSIPIQPNNEIQLKTFIDELFHDWGL